MGDDYDVAVIGAGTGGYSAALRSAQLGKRVVLIERDDRLGGTCLLRGCIPTKALLRSAEVLDTVRRADRWGVQASGEPDPAAVRAFEDGIVDKLVGGLTGLVGARGIDVRQGLARIEPGGGLTVDEERIEATDVVVATGSSPRLIPGVETGERIWTSDEALRLEAFPASVVVIGAGAVGLEFASLYRSFGAEVTVLEALPRLAPLEDEDVSARLARAYRDRGIRTEAGVAVTEVRDTGEAVEVTFGPPEESGGETLAVERCLVAIGRGPVTEGLGLAEADVAMTERGFVEVDDRLRTSVPGVWAVGDVAATPLQLAHVAFTEGIAVAERIAGIDVPPIDYVNIPRVTYCSPEIASVGLTEAQAREAGMDVRVEKLDLRGIGKANILDEGGMVKIVAESGGGPVLGVHLIGPHATDLIAEGMLLTAWEALPEEAAAMLHPHPSLSEGIGEALLALAGKPLHSP